MVFPAALSLPWKRDEMTYPTKASQPLGALVTVAACMISTCIVAACMATAGVAQAQAQAASPLLGDWRAHDGSAVARIATCSAGESLCATVIEERLAPGDASSLGRVVVRNLRPANGGWKGEYISDRQAFPARARLVNADTIEFQVCAAAIVCDTARYMRVKGSTR
ncbi:hypothetical protein CAP40_14105 [Sphingomonas sp. IBVSS2]|nr:hypothetical protein CAP40_14105 [Sphingomonas sp. IBVSS2]